MFMEGNQMVRKFLEGLVFGTGFGISFLVLSYLFTYLIFPTFISHQLQTSITKQPVENKK